MSGFLWLFYRKIKLQQVNTLVVKNFVAALRTCTAIHAELHAIPTMIACKVAAIIKFY